MLRIAEIPMPLAFTEKELRRHTARRLKVPESALGEVRLYRKSVDARKKNDVHFTCTVEAQVDGEKKVLSRLRDSKIQLAQPYEYCLPSCEPLSQRPVIAGFGPAGLFAALILAQAGQKPIVLERGAPVDERSRTVEHFWSTGEMNPESNVQFGEGGAGTFSDGKLNTGTKDPRARKVLEEFVKAGAPEQILTDAKPHIGTDRLPGAVKAIRETIIRLGGEVHFHTTLTGLQVREGRLTGVMTRKSTGERGIIETDALVLAVGHSARDTFSMLYDAGLHMEAKAFSVGARIEHPQSLINQAQYGPAAEHPALGAADYKLAVHLPENGVAAGRGVYTFCMCPGGFVVAAASEEGRVVTNGMSCFARDGKNANAALLVGVAPEDFGSGHPLAGIDFQRKLEEAAFRVGGGDYHAPAQRVEDFLQNRASTRLGEVEPTYRPGVTPCNLSACLPEVITEAMRQGIRLMDRRLHGFAYPDAVLTGTETRSSSPVRIIRDESCQSVSLRGFYPCGEGAGYAGGIISAAVDGIRCAEKVMENSQK